MGVLAVGEMPPMAVKRRVESAFCGATTGSSRLPVTIVAGERTFVNGSALLGGQASVQFPSWRFSPRFRSRLRLIPAARVVHQALFLTTPR